MEKWVILSCFQMTQAESLLILSLFQMTQADSLLIAIFKSLKCLSIQLNPMLGLY